MHAKSTLGQNKTKQKQSLLLPTCPFNTYLLLCVPKDTIITPHIFKTLP